MFQRSLSIITLIILMGIGGCSSVAPHVWGSPSLSYPESARSGVVLLAISQDEGSKLVILNEFMKMLEIRRDERAARLIAEGSLLASQLEIAVKASEVSSVVLLVRDTEVGLALKDLCPDYSKEFCDALERKVHGIHVRQTSHRSPWIRDYGPQVFRRRSRTWIIDAKYTGDPRSRTELARARKSWREELFRLLQAQKDQLEGAVEFLDTIERQKAEVLQALLVTSADESLYQRTDDDLSFSSIAEAVLSPRRRVVQHSSLALEGGNLLRLGDGACLTTTDLAQQNETTPFEVERVLRRDFSCRRTIFLAPLPGNAIKHVDMFALPVSGKRILLASYHVGAKGIPPGDYGKLPPEIRKVVRDAAVTMKMNKVLLKQRGYEVVEVPSLPPERAADGARIWYPSLLNALVHRGVSGKVQVIAPEYKERLPELQRKAKAIVSRQFEEAFGSDIQLHFVESTQAAMMQGAVHCLSLVVPSAASHLIDESAFSEEVAELVDDFGRRDAELLRRERVLEETRKLTGTWFDASSSHVLTFQGDGSVVVREGELEQTLTCVIDIDPDGAEDGREYDVLIGNQRGHLVWKDARSFHLQMEGEPKPLSFVLGLAPRPETAPVRRKPQKRKKSR